MISRDEAIDVIFKVVHTGVHEHDLEKKMAEIAQCIMAEKIGWHLWGLSDDEIGILAKIVSADSPEYKEHIKKQLEISERISFTEGDNA